MLADCLLRILKCQHKTDLNLVVFCEDNPITASRVDAYPYKCNKTFMNK